MLLGARPRCYPSLPGAGFTLGALGPSYACDPLELYCLSAHCIGEVQQTRLVDFRRALKTWLTSFGPTMWRMPEHASVTEEAEQTSHLSRVF